MRQQLPCPFGSCQKRRRGGVGPPCGRWKGVAPAVSASGTPPAVSIFTLGNPWAPCPAAYPAGNVPVPPLVFSGGSLHPKSAKKLRRLTALPPKKINTTVLGFRCPNRTQKPLRHAPKTRPPKPNPGFQACQKLAAPSVSRAPAPNKSGKNLAVFLPAPAGAKSSLRRPSPGPQPPTKAAKTLLFFSPPPPAHPVQIFRPGAPARFNF